MAPWANGIDGTALQYAPFIHAVNASDLIITGGGTIDSDGFFFYKANWCGGSGGGGHSFCRWTFASVNQKRSFYQDRLGTNIPVGNIELFCRCGGGHCGGKLPHARPRLAVIEGAERVELSNFTTNNSGYWNLVVLESSDVHIHHVRVRNPSGVLKRLTPFSFSFSFLSSFLPVVVILNLSCHIVLLHSIKGSRKAAFCVAQGARASVVARSTRLANASGRTPMAWISSL